MDNFNLDYLHLLKVNHFLKCYIVAKISFNVQMPLGKLVKDVKLETSVFYSL